MYDQTNSKPHGARPRGTGTGTGEAESLKQNISEYLHLHFSCHFLGLFPEDRTMVKGRQHGPTI